MWSRTEEEECFKEDWSAVDMQERTEWTGAASGAQSEATALEYPEGAGEASSLLMARRVAGVETGAFGG